MYIYIFFFYYFFFFYIYISISHIQYQYNHTGSLSLFLPLCTYSSNLCLTYPPPSLSQSSSLPLFLPRRSKQRSFRLGPAGRFCPLKGSFSRPLLPSVTQGGLLGSCKNPSQGVILDLLILEKCLKINVVVKRLRIDEK